MPDEPTEYIPPWKLPSETTGSELLNQSVPNEQFPQPPSATASLDKNTGKINLLGLLVVVFLVIGALGLPLFTVWPSMYFKFVLEGSIETIQRDMFLKIFIQSGFLKLLVGYLIISLSSVYLIFFTKINAGSKILLAILILLMITIFGFNYPSVNKETNEFNSLLETVKYPNVKRYEFQRNKLSIKMIEVLTSLLMRKLVMC